MKIAESEVIKIGEQELIDAITGDLDWNTIEKLLLEKHNFRLQEDVEYRSGDIVVHDNAIAYKLDFDVKVSLSVLFNRSGECLELSTSGEVKPETAETSAPEEVPPQGGTSEPAPLEPQETISATPGDPDLMAEAHMESEAPDIAPEMDAVPEMAVAPEMDAVPEMAVAPEMEVDPGIKDAGLSAFDGDVGEEPLEMTENLPGVESAELMQDDDVEELEPVLGLDLADVDLDIPDMEESAGMSMPETEIEPAAPASAATGPGPGVDATGAQAAGESGPESREQITEMASQIADMISEINED